MSTSHAQERRHPTLKQYIAVATILFVITAVEFLLIYDRTEIDFPGWLITTLLVVLSAFKFGIVIMFYMHLRFDSKLFSWVFLGGLALAFAVFVGVLGIFGALHTQPEPRAFAEQNAVSYQEHGEGGGAPGPESGPGPTPPGEQPGETPETPPTTPPSGGGDVAAGQAVFTGSAGCTACHTIEGISSGTVGPDLTDIGTDAAMMVQGMSAEEYIRQSIEDPSAFVMSGYPDGVMPKDFSTRLTGQEINDLVAFLLSHK